MRWILVLFFLAVIVAVAVGAWPRMEGEAPVLSGPPAIELGVVGKSFEFSWEDAGSGLRSVEAFLLPGVGPDEIESAAGEDGEEWAAAENRIELHQKKWRGTAMSGPPLPTQSERVSLELDAEALGLEDGHALLVMRARDWSWSDGFEGNASELRIPIQIDRKPPSLSVASGLTYVRRGGAAAVVYRVGDDAVRSGARVGEAWFPGARMPDGGHLSVFAIPIDADPEPLVEVVAVDAFGNESTARFDLRVQPRVFREISIPLSDRFLDRVGSRLGEASDMTEATPLATFQRVNQELRELNESVIAGAIGEPSAKQWEGGFLQMRNSSVTSHFAELRHYTYRGQRVSIARHYGYDLASTSHAPIIAANDGTVVYAGDNGIYGTLVLIDHGLGITTLYGHLSNLAVKVGDSVKKAQELGRSGATGLAGGDHLHFAVLVGKTYVDPIEWWDPKWVDDHIQARIAP